MGLFAVGLFFVYPNKRRFNIYTCSDVMNMYANVVTFPK